MSAKYLDDRLSASELSGLVETVRRATPVEYLRQGLREHPGPSIAILSLIVENTTSDTPEVRALLRGLGPAPSAADLQAARYYSRNRAADETTLTGRPPTSRDIVAEMLVETLREVMADMAETK